MTLWSMYWTALSTFTRGTPSCSNCMQAIVPVASCSSVWSIRSEIGSPGSRSPSTRCSLRIWRVRFSATNWDPMGVSLRERAEALVASKAGSWWFLNVANRIDRVLLPATRGRISSAPGRQVLLLDTIGAKSGERRRTPLQFVRDGDHVVLIASRGGDVKHPAWFHNLNKTPDVHVVGPRITGGWRARVAQGDERTRLWRIAADYYPGYDTYSARAGGREIPVVVLERT